LAIYALRLGSATAAPLASDDTMSFISGIKTQKRKRVGFPGNPIFKIGPKPLKNGVKKVTFLQLDAGNGQNFEQKSGAKIRFQSIMISVK
jgi:hypothetical protein